METDAGSTFEIGLTVAHAVSAGAYTAGVADFLLDALEVGHLQRTIAPDSVLSDRINLRVMSGDSAGAMTAAIVAANALDHFPAVRPGSEKADGWSHSLFTAWVDRIEIIRMLKRQDLAGRARPVSLLSTTMVDQSGTSSLNQNLGHRERTLRMLHGQ
jgi:hypothetical protein